jgi:phosphoribosylformylglycinamidine synthase
MTLKVVVIQFSGSTCDRDLVYAMEEIMGWKVDLLWHDKAVDQLEKYDAIFLPGGFTYGDYLRAGIIAAFTPVMENVKKLAGKGMPVLGICNGFQILIEAGLLPGALVGNESLRFSCKWVNLQVANTKSAATVGAEINDIWRIPIAHGEGRYYCEQEQLEKLKENDQIVWRYVTPEGKKTKEANPNGSIDNIAGICNKKGNVVGLMPHPERAAEKILSPWKTEHGKNYFQSLKQFIRG